MATASYMVFYVSGNDPGAEKKIQELANEGWVIIAKLRQIERNDLPPGIYWQYQFLMEKKTEANA